MSPPGTDLDTAPSHPSGGRCLTEEEAERLEFERTGGQAGERYEPEVVFGLLGAGSAIVLLVFGWVAFKKIWFAWLEMPGWW